MTQEVLTRAMQLKELAGHRGISWPDQQAEQRFEEICTVIQSVVQEKERAAAQEVQDRINDFVSLECEYSFFRMLSFQVQFSEGVSDELNN